MSVDAADVRLVSFHLIPFNEFCFQKKSTVEEVRPFLPQQSVARTSAAMDMMDIIHDLSTLPADDAELQGRVHVALPRDNTGGKGKSARIGFGSLEKVVYFQTPRVYCPFGTNVFKSDSGFEKLTLLITIQKDMKGSEDYLRLVRAVDEAVVQAAFENQDAWFGTAKKDYKNLEIIRDRHHPLVQDRAPYEPQMKLKITEDHTRIFDKNNNTTRIEGHEIPEKITGRGVVAFGPAWSAGGKFGVMAKLEQFLIIDTGMIRASKRSLDACVLKDDDDEEDAPRAAVAARRADDEPPYVPLNDQTSDRLAEERA